MWCWQCDKRNIRRHTGWHRAPETAGQALATLDDEAERAARIARTPSLHVFVPTPGEDRCCIRCGQHVARHQEG